MQGNRSTPSLHRTKVSQMSEEEQKPNRLGTIAIVLIAFLVVYTVSLSVFVVFLVRDYTAVKSQIQLLDERVQNLERVPVTAEAVSRPVGDRNKEQEQRGPTGSTSHYEVSRALVAYLFL